MSGHTLVLVRHGESTGNADGIFTGLLEVGLTELGRVEAVRAADLLAQAGLYPPVWFSSPMVRTRQTVEILLDTLRSRLPEASPPQLEFDWRLAERNYGALTGRTKTEVREQFGTEQYTTWRRSLSVAPPPMSPEHRAHLARLAGEPAPEWLGMTESLADVVVRVGECFVQRILPTLNQHGSALVLAHGNSLRALCTVLDELDEPAVRALNLPTAQPLVYRIDRDGRPLGSGSYLDPTTAHAAAALIAQQGGT